MDTIPPAVQELIDRQQIYDCIVRYCSGVDRFDRDMLLSVYHPDAWDDHGLFVGPATDFVDWAITYHSKYHHGHKHYVLNHRCELNGSTAHAETYWLFCGLNKIGDPVSLHGGRYLDRFEKREDKWAIAARNCMSEWHGTLGHVGMPAEVLAALTANGTAARDRSDPSYRRPLKIERPKQMAPL